MSSATEPLMPMIALMIWPISNVTEVLAPSGSEIVAIFWAPGGVETGAAAGAGVGGVGQTHEPEAWLQVGWLDGHETSGELPATRQSAFAAIGKKKIKPRARLVSIFFMFRKKSDDDIWAKKS